MELVTDILEEEDSWRLAMSHPLNAREGDRIVQNDLEVLRRYRIDISKSVSNPIDGIHNSKRSNNSLPLNDGSKPDLCLIEKGFRIQWNPSRATNVILVGSFCDPCSAIKKAIINSTNVEMIGQLKLMLQKFDDCSKSMQGVISYMTINPSKFDHICLHEHMTLKCIFGVPVNNEYDLLNTYYAHFVFGYFVNKGVSKNIGSLKFCQSFNTKLSTVCLRCDNMYIDSHRCCPKCERCKHVICICGTEKDKNSERTYRRWTKKTICTQIKSQNPESEKCLIVRMTHDYETVTNRWTNVIQPVCVVMSVSVLLADDIGVRYVADIAHFGDVIIPSLHDFFDRVAATAGLDKVDFYPPDYVRSRFDKRTGKPWMGGGLSESLVNEMSNNSCTVSYFKMITPEEFMCWKTCPAEFSPARCVVNFQNTLYDSFRKGVGHPFEELGKLTKFVFKNRQCKVLLCSHTFNGAFFDESFNLPFRFYNHLGLKMDYALKGGGIIKCNTQMNFEEVDEHPFKWRVELKLSDLAKNYSHITLRKLCENFKLEVQKGEVDFDLLNDFYNKIPHEGCETGGFKYHVEKLEMESYKTYKDKEVYDATMNDHEIMFPFNEDDEQYHKIVIDTEEDDILKHLTKDDTRRVYYTHIILAYCCKDVIVTDRLTDIFQKSITKLSQELLGFSVTVATTLSTPGITRKFMYYYQDILVSRSLSTPFYALQGPCLDMAYASIYGGISEISVLGTVKAVYNPDIGMLDGIDLLDVNGEYMMAMTGLFPKGPVRRGCVNDYVSELVKYLKRCKLRGFRNSWNDSYTEIGSDFGFLIAMCDVSPPEDRKKLMTWAVVPTRNLTGSLIWSNEGRSQILNSEDMELLARAGWDVIPRVDYPMLFWKEAENCMEPYMNFLARKKAEFTAENNTVDREIIKLVANSAFGKTLQKEIKDKTEVRDIEELDESVKDSSKTPVQHPYTFAGDCNNPADHSYNRLVVCRGKKKFEERDVNTTPVQNGSFILSKARAVMAQLKYFAYDRSQNELDPYERRADFFACETDSLHARKSAILRIPYQILCDKSGYWDHEIKDFRFFCKHEDFQKGILVSNAPVGYFIAKKLYYYPPPPPETVDGVVVNKAKFASKGFEKAALTEDLIKQSLANFKIFDGVTVRDKPVNISVRHMKRRAYGMAGSGVAGTIMMETMTRRLDPNINGKCYVGSCDINDIDLTETFIMLHPFDSLNRECNFEPKTYREQSHASKIESGEALFKEWVRRERERFEHEPLRWEATADGQGRWVDRPFFGELIRYEPVRPTKRDEVPWDEYEGDNEGIPYSESESSDDEVEESREGGGPSPKRARAGGAGASGYRSATGGRGRRGGDWEGSDRQNEYTGGRCSGADGSHDSTGLGEPPD